MRTNVYFIGDSYRGDQATNIQRLFEIFGHVVNAYDAKAELRISDLNRLTGFENWLLGWVRSLRREEASALSDLDPATSAVVAFELSGVDRLQLDAAGIPWVNFEIHPVRFLEDLYLGVEASFPIDLSPVEIPDDYVSLRAEVLRAKYRPIVQTVSENRLLIVGQTPIDKSIYFDGEFKQLPDYFAGLDPIVAGFDGTDYRPHPYLTDAEVDASIRTRYGAGACDEPNIYKVFTSGRYRAVCGISSSVLCEAPFFGLQSTALEPRARRFGRPISYAKLIRDCHLWLSGLLEVDVEPRKYDALPPVPDNYLRQVYCSWAYVTQEEEIRQALSSIDTRVGQAEKALAALVQEPRKEHMPIAAPSLRGDSNEAMKLPEPPYPQRDAAYYQRLHEEEACYQTNNWMLEELDQIRAFGGRSLLEIACGNGRFIECAAPFFERVTGCDWAISPRIQEVMSRNPNVSFQRVDMYRELPVGQPDLVVSADFLEHLAPETLPEIVRRIDSLSSKAFHKIACYDDGHSHLSIMPPGKWLALFRGVDPGYRLERVELRLGDPAREIAVFTKGRPGPVALGVEQVLAVAQSLLDTEALEEAQETLGEGLRQHPGDRLLSLARANVLLAQDKASQAIEILKALVEDFPSDPLVLVNLGGAYFRAGQLDEAGAAACMAYSLAPENEDVCLLMEILEPSPMTHSSPHHQNQRGRHFDFGKAIGGRDEVTQYFAERYEASSILDIGCGSGPVWRQFFDKGMAITGVDLVPTEVVMAGHLGHVANYFVGDFLDVQLPDTYDAVYSSHTIEHVPDTERFLRKFFSNLRPGGAFCLVWPPPKPEVVSGHVHVFSLGLMLYNLVRIGVDCRKVEMVRCGYCLALMGRYQIFSLPELTHNEGDLDRLGAFFPFQANQGFDGDHPAGVVNLPVAGPG